MVELFFLPLLAIAAPMIVDILHACFSPSPSASRRRNRHSRRPPPRPRRRANHYTARPGYRKPARQFSQLSVIPEE
ncbi:hypothetical protein F5Y10DRAFT_243778 [Nemania abortiva]|nr:hypothetical protein F5Y10DRAFT_243778 [Nemania abortiva]